MRALIGSLFIRRHCYTPLVEKGTKQMQNRPMETADCNKAVSLSINNSEKITKNDNKTGYYDVMVCNKFKFWQITRHRFATRKKLGIRLLFGYEYRAQSGVITRLELYSNRNFKIRLLQFMLRIL